VSTSASGPALFYTPQPDGSLRGTWQTNIYSGPCYGTVVMDVASFAVT
jgi:hypothetical protein